MCREDRARRNWAWVGRRGQGGNGHKGRRWVRRSWVWEGKRWQGGKGQDREKMGKEELGMGREKRTRRKKGTGQGEDGQGGVGNWFGGEGNEEMGIGRGRWHGQGEGKEDSSL